MILYFVTRAKLFLVQLVVKNPCSHCLDLDLNGLLTRRNIWCIPDLLGNYTIPKWKEFLKSREPILRKSYLSTFIHINKHMGGARVSFSSCQRNLIKTFQIEAMIALITEMILIFFMRLVKWPKIDIKKCQNLIFRVNFQHQKSFKSF